MLYVVLLIFQNSDSTVGVPFILFNLTLYQTYILQGRFTSFLLMTQVCFSCEFLLTVQKMAYSINLENCIDNNKSKKYKLLKFQRSIN